MTIYRTTSGHEVAAWSSAQTFAHRPQVTMRLATMEDAVVLTPGDASELAAALIKAVVDTGIVD